MQTDIINKQRELEEDKDKFATKYAETKQEKKELEEKATKLTSRIAKYKAASETYTSIQDDHKKPFTKNADSVVKFIPEVQTM